MDSNRSDLLSLYKKRFRRKQLYWDVLSISYQKADMEEYFNTVRAKSINVVRKK